MLLLYLHVEKIIDKTWKIRISFYEHLQWMNDNIPVISKRIVMHSDRFKMDKTEAGKKPKIIK